MDIPAMVLLQSGGEACWASGGWGRHTRLNQILGPLEMSGGGMFGLFYFGELLHLLLF
jgi:hypothetical protein